MKKLVSVILVLVTLFCTAAVAEGIDLSVMTEEELRLLIANAEAELAKFAPEVGGPLVEGALMYEDENVRMTYSGMIEIDALMNTLDIGVIVENLSTRNLYITVTNASCNDWAVMDTVVEVPAGKNARAELLFWDAVENAQLNSVEDVKKIEGAIYCMDTDTFDIFETSEPMIWIFHE